MRQLFSSPRIENVEAVARLLEEAGIEVRISNGRSYRGAIRGNFSYRDGSDSAPRPAVWVLRSDQQPEARQLLRDAGLLQAAPVRGESFLPPAAIAGGDRSPLSARGGGRFRYGLLMGIAVIAAVVIVNFSSGDKPLPADPAPTVAAAPDAGHASASTATGAPGAAGLDMLATLPEEVHRVPTPPLLAATLVRDVLDDRAGRRACLAIDDADPAASLIETLAADGLDVVPASSARCDEADRTRVEVRDYRTDGSGSGSVQLAVAGEAARELAVRRDGSDWQRVDGP
ncbi:DUF2007 domain-containing protein [Luteimonas sp. MC1572]|uniref:DUF2007 domain-containing protein n=1 Tax=Luteimonas sp. MC1572 TaxID=2799325 RepID=UPI0018F0A3DF|nr:DUF2007 domain-containing protein [Luteimonas sp. MC1572]MBJ6982527.1 DUF2007 domain-containing protein [Luteimonas sp. MC1572]QQO03779.1 DUF2007 domain-containing protein [Luteimonas sp. MC1572]